MTAFAIGTEIAQREPVVVVDPLEPGTYRFQLIVVDDAKLESAPAVLRVTVLPREPRRDRIPPFDFPIDFDPNVVRRGPTRGPIPNPFPPRPGG